MYQSTAQDHNIKCTINVPTPLDCYRYQPVPETIKIIIGLHCLIFSQQSEDRAAFSTKKTYSNIQSNGNGTVLNGQLKTGRGWVVEGCQHGGLPLNTSLTFFKHQPVRPTKQSKPTATSVQ